MRGHVARKGTKFYVVVDLGTDPVTGRRKQKWHSGFATKREADKALTALLYAVDTGDYVEPNRITLERFVRDEWLPASAARVRASTLLSYRLTFDHHLLPQLGQVRLGDLTALSITRHYGYLLTAGRANGRGGLSPRTVRYAHALLRRALADAVRWRYLARNPADHATPPSHTAARAPEMRTWTAAELRRFLDFCGPGDPWLPAFHLAATCGLRRGETAGVRWRDLALDADPPVLAVRQQLVEVHTELRLEPPKTSRGRRVVVLDPVTVAMLRRLRLAQRQAKLALGGGYNDHDLVICHPNGAPVHPGSLTQAFRDRAVASGLPRIRFHDLRHTHASLALAAGIHPKVVSERLGHATTSFTLDVYSHTLPTLQYDAANLISRLIFDPPPQSLSS